jgi:hypothetical protein
VARLHQTLQPAQHGHDFQLRLRQLHRVARRDDFAVRDQTAVLQTFADDFFAPTHVRAHDRQPALKRVERVERNGNVRHHQTPSNTIKHHQTPSNTIKHHQTPSNIIKHYQTPSNIKYNKNGLV